LFLIKVRTLNTHHESTATALIQLQCDLSACTRCVAAGYIPDARPVFRGKAGHRQMIVGQAPGARGHQTGVPWSGVSGDVLRTWFARAGYPAGAFLDTWYFTSLTKCFPGKVAGGKGDRAPSAAERTLCAPWLEGEIELVRPELIVTLGRLAADALIPGTRRGALGEVIGKVWMVDLGYGEIPAVPLPHPSGVSRWLNDGANRILVERALDQLAALREDTNL
jgi:uracil-DNA glycosylase